jgi:hypothetical protein
MPLILILAQLASSAEAWSKTSVSRIERIR